MPSTVCVIGGSGERSCRPPRAAVRSATVEDLPHPTSGRSGPHTPPAPEACPLCPRRQRRLRAGDAPKRTGLPRDHWVDGSVLRQSEVCCNQSQREAVLDRRRRRRRRRGAGVVRRARGCRLAAARRGARVWPPAALTRSAAAVSVAASLGARLEPTRVPDRANPPSRPSPPRPAHPLQHARTAHARGCAGARGVAGRAHGGQGRHRRLECVGPGRRGAASAAGGKQQGDTCAQRVQASASGGAAGVRRPADGHHQGARAR